MSIKCWDSNPEPQKHESPPITTRPGLPPSYLSSYKAIQTVAVFLHVVKDNIFYIFGRF